jgi:hypothetical protein
MGIASSDYMPSGIACDEAWDGIISPCKRGVNFKGAAPRREKVANRAGCGRISRLII